MPARSTTKKKTTKRGTKKKRVSPNPQDYPLLTVAEYESLTPQEKLRFLDYLKQRSQQDAVPNLDNLFKAAPDLVKQCMAIWTAHFGKRTRLTATSMWAHIGVLAGGTMSMCWLGLESVLDGATIVAVLGPLYTYVLINLRYLTGWKIIGESNSGS